MELAGVNGSVSITRCDCGAEHVRGHVGADLRLTRDVWGVECWFMSELVRLIGLTNIRNISY